MRKTLWLAAVLALLLSLTACSGGGEAPSPAVPEDQRQVTDASELEGKWSSPSGNILYFVADEGCYYYQTFSGRTGQGRYDTSGDVPMIDFDGFLYDFILRDDGVLLPNQNGSGDAESFDHFTFTRSDARVDIWDIAQLDGVWQNALGETLVIDSQRMEYLSYTRLSAGSGTIGDAGDGKGPLSVHGRLPRVHLPRPGGGPLRPAAGWGNKRRLLRRVLPLWPGGGLYRPAGGQL